MNLKQGKSKMHFVFFYVAILLSRWRGLCANWDFSSKLSFFSFFFSSFELLGLVRSRDSTLLLPLIFELWAIIKENYKTKSSINFWLIFLLASTFSAKHPNSFPSGLAWMNKDNTMANYGKQNLQIGVTCMVNNLMETDK